MATQPAQLYRSGLGLKTQVADQLDQNYSSQIIDFIKVNGYRLQLDNLTLLLAQEFGFCYGVDRAVDYAYQTRQKFPDRRIFLTGEIIHNPHVNRKMLEMGIEFLTGQYAQGNSYGSVQQEDVVILPAFGVTMQELELLRKKGCVLVDTTCGSVLNVWKRVEQYARDGFTSIIHGKHYHEESRATSSQVLNYPNGHYLIVYDMQDTELVCNYITGKWNRKAFCEKFSKAISPNFDPDRHLEKVGLANQTTMLSSESLAIAERIRQTMLQKYGEAHLDKHFRTFDTICSATQERQDAVIDLLEKHHPDVMLVVGGYNSSNTHHLAELSVKYTHAYHINDAACLVGAHEIHYKPVNGNYEDVARDWLPGGKVRVGLTAGASTPNSKIGEVVARLAEIRGIDLQQVTE